MAQFRNDRNGFRDYLLGHLTDTDQQEFERRLISSEDVLEELLASEDDLIDEYLAQQLAPADRDAFEQHFLVTAERQEKLRFARALRRYVQTSAPPPELPTPGLLLSRKHAWALVVSMVVLVAVAASLWLYRSKPTSSQLLAKITLTPSSGTRGEVLQTLKVGLPSRDGELEAVLILPAERMAGDEYRVSLEDVAGDMLDARVIAHDTRSVTVRIPAIKLHPGQYVLKLFARGERGEERVPGSFFFDVE